MAPDHHDATAPRSSDVPELPAAGVVPTWMARAWVIAGTVGVVASLLGAIVGVVFVRSLAATSLEALALSETVLGTVDDTATLLDDTITDVAAALDTAGATVGETTATLDEVSTTLDDLTVLVTEDVPTSLDAIGDAMPQVISTAGVVDSTMRALRFVGVDYDPDAPLDESLQEVDDQLAEIAPSLRDQREGMESVGTRLETLAQQGATLSDDVAAITDDLAATQELVDEFGTVANEAAAVTADFADRLIWQARVTQVVLVVFALALAVTQTVPIMLGMRMLGWNGRWPPGRRRVSSGDRTPVA
ncbi:MAG TPA: hypothetical protein VJ978_02065 [Nitriliruptoraceae bacterium]|nr:hypothetical protein [Nitriliruptoraceae bacterium]